MSRWPVHRRWTLVGVETPREVSTDQLTDFPGLCLVGTAGLGKTFELEYLLEVERRAGREVRKVRAAELAHSAEALARSLDQLATIPTPTTTIYVDALDEAMVPVRHTGLIVAAWLRNRILGTGISVRLSCRSAVFPDTIRAALSEVYGDASPSIAALEPLTLDDVATVADHVGVDRQAFLRLIDRSRAEALATQPLTLSMLLRVSRSGRQLPNTRAALFEEGVRWLATERSERIEDGTAVEVAVDDLLDAAERLSCFTLLSGVELVDYGDLQLDNMLNVHELGALPGGTRPLDAAMLRALRQSGLCERGGPTAFRMAHRQIAEYLAGRRLARLLPHQAKALLASSLGSDFGVAGALRETAAFVASASEPIAGWVSERDPEVIGMSDVADQTLRRRATLNVLLSLRRHELTDSQLWRGALQVEGLRYAGAEADLRPILGERTAESNDVLQGAIWFVDQWKLEDLSEALADVTLDVNASREARKKAGYAIQRFGTVIARRRLLSLIQGGPDDPDDDFKGLALRSNYPDRIGGRELLTILTRPRRGNYGGAYAGFLYHLSREGFNAEECLIDGLVWARQFFSAHEFDSDPLVQIAKSICRAALDHLNDADVAAALAQTLVHAAQHYAPSPLLPRSDRLVDDGADRREVPWTQDVVRRRVIEILVEQHPTDAQLWWAIREVPGFLNPSDLEWAVMRAVDTTFDATQRERYAELANLLTRVIVAPAFQAGSAQPAVPTIEPPTVAPQVEQLLHEAETGNTRNFLPLSRVLNVSATNPQRLEFNRFVTESRGWQAADPGLRDRIVGAAKRLLTTEIREPADVGFGALNTIRSGFMDAAWLVLACDVQWLESRSPEWWALWAWYFMRETHPYLSGEPSEPKEQLLRLVYARAPDTARAALRRLVQAPALEARHLLEGLLNLGRPIPDSALDQELCDLLTAGAVPADRVESVAQFVLERDAQRGLAASYSVLAGETSGADDPAVAAAVALLSTRTADSLSTVGAFVLRRRDLAARILGEFASRMDRGGHALTTAEAADLVALLIEFFPPEEDPVHSGAHMVGPQEEARMLRDRLISWLGEQSDIETVQALRALEQRFAGRYPWLRRPRATAERAYRLSRWSPIPPRAVAAILSAADKRLVRTNLDAVEGIVEAIRGYEDDLRHVSPSDLEDLWNRPRGGRPSPKEEERVSDKVCGAIRRYFRSRAVTAEREVQIHRRLVSSRLGGNPGSELDVLVDIPAIASETGDAINVPIEVKLANNPEARTGLRAQLFDRYMNQLGTDCGVFVVVWMDAPGIAKGHKPLWNSPQEAAAELEQQASSIAESNNVVIRIIVIDASIKGNQSPPGRRTTGKAKRVRPAHQSTAKTPRKTARRPRKRIHKP